MPSTIVNLTKKPLVGCGKGRVRAAHTRSGGRLIASACGAALASILVAQNASGLTINLTYDADTMASANFSQIKAATQYVANEYAADFATNVTINISCNQSNTSSLGGSTSYGAYYTYAQVRTAMQNHINSPDEALAFSTLPTTDPTNGGSFYVPYSQAQVLGLSNTVENGVFQFNITYPLNYSTTNRAVSGQYDFTGIAEHEFSEVMGRFSGLNVAGRYGIMDLFRYSASGVRALSSSVSNAYFSMDGGVTSINTYNNAAVNGGDYGDWSGATNDSYNAFSNSGVTNPVSTGDLAVMDVLGYNQPLDSTNVYWRLNQNGSLATAANWVGGKAPSINQTAQFNLLGNPYTVSGAGNVGGLYVHNNSVTLDAGGGTLTLHQTTNSADALVIGQAANENGTLYITDGTFTVNENSGFVSSIAQQPGSTGYIFVQPGATFNDNGTLYVGEYGSGEIQCRGGVTNVTGTTFSMAQDAGSLGRAALDSGAVLNTNFANIGTNGAAYFYQNGGTHNVANNLGLANFGNSSGYYGMYGGNLNVSGYAFINYDSSGTATFNQTGGAVWVGVGLVVGTFGGPGNYYLGQSGAIANPQPTLAVTGAETIGASAAIGGVPNGTYTQYGETTNYVGYNANLSAASPSELYVGNGGNGLFNMYGGGTEVNGTVLIASGSGSVGVVNLINQDADDPAELYVLGNEIIGDSGNGTMVVNNGTNLVLGSVTVGNNGTGSLTISNGGSVSAGTTLTIANNAGSIGNLNISGDTLSVGSLMTIGNSGSGTLTQTGGSITTGAGGNNPALIIGSATNSVGTYVLNGSGSLAVNGAVWLGSNGQGTINQSAGVVTVGSGIPNTLYIGYGGGSGAYFLSGSGSLVDHGDEIVGWYGSGIFNQTGGTNVVGSSSSPWHLYLGFQSGSTGTYSLSGNGALTVNNVEQVGVSGSGIFNQSGGTHQVNGQLTLGVGTSSQALFLLSDPAAVGTSLTVTGNEIIGNNANGSGSTPGAVFQQSGGTHTVGSTNSAATLTVAQNSGSTATYLLSGGTLNVNSSGISGLTIGAAGNGVLNQSGGTLNASYEAVGNSSNGTVIQSNGVVGGAYSLYDLQLGVKAGASGAYFLSGGTLNASEEEIGVSGSGTFNQGGGTNLVNFLYVADANGKGMYQLSAGTLQSNSEFIESNAGSSFLQTGGFNTVLPGSYNLSIGGYGGAGTYNQTGGTLVTAYENIGSQGISGTGTVIMKGGVAQVGVVFIGGGPTGNMTVTGSAVFNISGPSTTSGVGPLSVYAGSSLTINGNGRLNLLPHSAGTFTADLIESISISGAGTLDVSNNALDLPFTNLSAATTLVGSGFANGAWTGAGIASSSAASDTKHLTALGVIQNNQSGTALYTSSHQFDGLTPGTPDVLVKYTYYGDTNLDGKVDGSDYSRIDNGYLAHLTGWFNGDFNYDSVVNGSDYTLIDNAFNRQTAQLTAQLASPTAQVAAAVPEPGVAGLVAVNAIALLRRRKRQIKNTVQW